MARLLFLQKIEYEFLGPMYISALAKQAGHSVRLELGDAIEDFEPMLAEFKPDLVAFSIMTGSQRWAQQIALEIRRRHGIPCIFGGAHPTFFPEFIREDGVNMLVRGEGEETVREILDRIDAGEPYDDVPNLTIRTGAEIRENPLRSLRHDLDEYPFPDRHLYDALNARFDRSVRNVITSRGCPFHCSFCFEDAMRDLYAGKGKYVRIRSIPKVIEELRLLKAETNVQTVYFSDDVFGMSKKWLYEFLPVYRREIGLPFVCLIRADIVAGDPEYAQRLADGGCTCACFGVESGNEQFRNQLLVKQLTESQIRLAADRLHQAGIKFRTYNIVGLPGETLADSFKTVDLNISIKADYPWCSVFMPFPGTALTDYALQHGYLDQTFEFNDLSKSFFTDSKLRSRDIEAMTNLQKFFQTAVLWPWTLPLIRKLIRLPPNPVFTAWFGLIYFYVYIKSENKPFRETLKFALRNYQHALAK